MSLPRKRTQSSDKIGIRLRALKFNLDQLNAAYIESQRCSYTDVGIEFDKPYEFDGEIQELTKKQKQLKKSREDTLFFTIFNFTQVYYSIKEYLRKAYPTKKDAIESFFSTSHLEYKARTSLSNDLKHNPENDLKYRLGQIGKEEIRREGKALIISTKSRFSWFYYDIETVEYCNKLYTELIQFLTESFKSKQDSQ